MTAVERSPRPGATWEREVLAGLEVVVPEDDGDSPFGWAEPDGPGFVSTALDPEPVVPRLNRAERRRLARAQRRRA